jgi:lantibiotic modifying enzyme
MSSPDRSARITRRELLEKTAAVALAGALPINLRDILRRQHEDERPWLAAARQAGVWIARSAISDEQGTRWPADPSDPASVSLDMYNGTTGVVPFWLELHHATGDSAALERAAAGADYLISRMPSGATAKDFGLYEGLAGTAYVLELTYRATKQEKYHDAAMRALGLIERGAQPAGAGVQWVDSTDIISGSAGTGLTLLWAHRNMKYPGALALATRAGKHLVEVGEPEKGGIKWRINAGMARNYPNFSHGTAGVSYFLAALSAATGDRTFLDAARGGATYLQAIATPTPNDGRMVFHSEPGNEQLYYLSWCHGPAGTARLFHLLGELTHDAAYTGYVDRLATALVDMKVPERSPGYWENISQCCGNCGVTEFFLSMHQLRGGNSHLDMAERVAADTLRRGTASDGGLKWIQAEHRVKPELLIAQTGLMQGAAGVGIAMLHLDGAREKRKPLVVLPDNPWS